MGKTLVCKVVRQYTNMNFKSTAHNNSEIVLKIEKSFPYTLCAFSVYNDQ